MCGESSKMPFNTHFCEMTVPWDTARNPMEICSQMVYAPSGLLPRPRVTNCIDSWWFLLRRFLFLLHIYHNTPCRSPDSRRKQRMALCPLGPGRWFECSALLWAQDLAASAKLNYMSLRRENEMLSESQGQ